MNFISWRSIFIQDFVRQIPSQVSKLAESIVIDMQDISKDIQKFRKIGGMIVNYLLSNYGEVTSTKKERFEAELETL